MLDRHSYDYAIIRVVPCVERGEFVNAGVLLYCREQDFLKARMQLNRDRLLALSPDVDVDIVQAHLDAFPRICDGDVSAGPIAGLSRGERFRWLVAPRSTIVQVSDVHSGLCESPEKTLDELFRRLVLK